MNMCINYENIHWNKVKRDNRKYNNYDKQEKGSHTKVVLLSPERLKKRVKNKIIGVKYQQLIYKILK